MRHHPVLYVEKRRELEHDASMTGSRFYDEDLVGRCDPVDGQALRRGETVVVCNNCGRGYRPDSWTYLGRCICGCTSNTRRVTLGQDAVRWQELPARTPVPKPPTRERVAPTGASVEPQAAPPASTSPPSSCAVPIIIAIALVLGIGLLATRSELGSPESSTPVAIAPIAAYVEAPELNLREGPGTEFRRIAVIKRGTQVLCIDVSRSSDGGTWTKVRVGSSEGWVNARFLRRAN
jgi:hypothetical protein